MTCIKRSKPGYTEEEDFNAGVVFENLMSKIEAFHGSVFDL